MVSGRGGRRGWLAAGALAAVVLAPAGWVVSDRLEQNNDFCNACHLEPGRPLHDRIRGDFDARPPANLAAAHAHAGNRDRDDGAFRCIDCHGGVGLVGRARVKALAAKDAFWYAAGRFEEPDSMRWPQQVHGDAVFDGQPQRGGAEQAVGRDGNTTQRFRADLPAGVFAADEKGTVAHLHHQAVGVEKKLHGF